LIPLAGPGEGNSFEVGADDLDDVVGGFFGGFGIVRHVIADVILHELGHEAVNSAAGGGEALEDVGAGVVFVEGAEGAFELADDFFGTVDEIEFFSGSMGHLPCVPYIGMVAKARALRQAAKAQ
jgi:hypothetical protein